MTDEDEFELRLDWDEDVGPSRPLRFLPPGKWVVEVTTRTIHGRYLLLPREEANAIIRGVIGRAHHLFPNVRIIGYWFLSNHWEALLEVPDSASLSAFMNHVNSNLARLLGELYDWPHKFWSRRYRGIVVVGDRALIRRLKYLLSQGTKENLVGRPCEWTGVSCLAGVLSSVVDKGVWFDRTREYRSRKSRAKRGNKPRPRSDFETTYEIHLSPLPCWARLSREEQQKRARRLVEEIEEAARARRLRTGKRPLGMARILAQDPDHRPDHIATSPAPLVHASSRQERNHFNDRYYRFLRRFRDASERFRSGETTAIDDFPPRCFLPRPPIGLRYVNRTRSAESPSTTQ